MERRDLVRTRRAPRAAVLFSRWPASGRGKRRLAGVLGDRRAADLARAFLRDTIEMLETSSAQRMVVSYCPPTARDRFLALAPSATLVAQSGVGLGARLEAALAAGLRVGSRAALVLSDAPTLPASYVDDAFRALDRADCVLGPAADGGYYLLGSKSALPSAMFTRVPWGSDRVLAITLERAQALGLRVALLREWYDIDGIGGLRRLTTDAAGLRRARWTREALLAKAVRKPKDIGCGLTTVLRVRLTQR